MCSPRCSPPSLKTVEAGNGFADIEALNKVVGDARIVALNPGPAKADFDVVLFVEKTTASRPNP